MAFTHLLRRADQGSLERGADYADRGLVEVLSTTPTRVTAVVRGSVEYDVVLDGRDGDCTCPVGQRGQFCKHLVATVMTLDDRATNSVADDLEDEDDGRVTPEELAELVDSLRVRGHPDYWKANALGEYASDVVDRLERALRADTADDLLPLLERGIDLVTRGMLRSDDSSGLQGIALQQLFDLHARAALMGSPDPGRLARWMVKTGFAEHGATRIDPVDYAEALGERGLAAYTRGVERHAAARPDGYEVRDARERLAVLARDIPAIIELAGGPLDNGMRYQHVVRTLLEVDAQDEALFYAEQGLGISSMEHAVVPLYDEAVRLRTSAGRSARRPLSSVAVSSTPSRPRRRTARCNEPPDPSAFLGGRKGWLPWTCCWSAIQATTSPSCSRRATLTSPGRFLAPWTSGPTWSCGCCRRGPRPIRRRCSTATSP